MRNPSIRMRLDVTARARLLDEAGIVLPEDFRPQVPVRCLADDDGLSLATFRRGIRKQFREGGWPVPDDAALQVLIEALRASYAARFPDCATPPQPSLFLFYMDEVFWRGPGNGSR